MLNWYLEEKFSKQLYNFALNGLSNVKVQQERVRKATHELIFYGENCCPCRIVTGGRVVTCHKGRVVRVELPHGSRWLNPVRAPGMQPAIRGTSRWFARKYQCDWTQWRPSRPGVQHLPWQLVQQPRLLHAAQGPADKCLWDCKTQP